MKGLIEYLIIFLVITVLCPNNIITTIYILSSIIAMIFYWIIHLKNIKNGFAKGYKYQLNIDLIIWLIMIVSINMINKLDITNLFFAFTTLAIFIVYSMAYLFKSEKLMSNKFLSYKYLFDFYTIIYLSSLLIAIMQHEI